MSRKTKLLLNTGTGLLKQVVVLICGFILPRYMILYFGSDVNGVVASITNFLGFITLLEMGIGPVIQSNLYKPLASKSTLEISCVIKSSERFFRRIAYCFIAYLLVLSILFPVVISPQFDVIFNVSLVLIISISTLAQYFFGATYQLLLNADQKAYVQQTLQIVVVLLNTIVCVVVMKLGGSVQEVKLISSLIFVIRPIGQIIYVKKHYNIDKHVQFEGEPIKQKWNGFAQHLAAVVSGNVDVVMLSFFSTMKNVSIYTIYFSVINGVTNIIMMAANGLEALFGNMIANNEKEKLNKTFDSVELIIHYFVTVVFTTTAITIIPFMEVYTRGISDANYIVPVFSVILVSAYGMQCLRVPYFRVIKAAGHFKETQNGAFIAAAINVVLSFVMVFKFGLIGIAMGTLVAMFYHTAYFVWYLRANILMRSIKYFVYNLVADLICVAFSLLVTHQVAFNGSNYFDWAIYALCIFAISAVCGIGINVVCFSKRIKVVLSLIK